MMFNEHMTNTNHTNHTTTMTCADASALVIADIARFCNEPVDPAELAIAREVDTAHYYGFGNCDACLAEQV